MVKFSCNTNTNIINGETLYSEQDRAFDFLPLKEVDINIAIAYLNLGFDSETMEAQCIWGFSPKESWNKMIESPPESVHGKLLLEGEYEAGSTWRIDKEKMWVAHYNAETGWFCIGDKEQESIDTNVEFATNIIAVLHSGKLKALWFKFSVCE